MYADQTHNHIIPLLAPVDTAGTAIQGDVFDAGECVSVEMQVSFGVITGDTVAVTVEECDDIVPTNSTAIAFEYRKTSAVGTDSVGAVTAATTSGVTMAADDDGKILQIFVDPAALTAGYPYLRFVATPGGSASVCLLQGVANVKPKKNPPGSMVD